MSKFYHETTHTPPSIKKTNPVYLQGFETPFKMSIYSSVSPFSVKISTLSNVLNSPSIDDKVITLGLGIPITIEYGNKIWLETFYDKNLNPVISVIRTGNKWPATVKNTSNQEESLEVYPNEFEFISQLDITDRETIIDNTITYIQAQKTDAQTHLELQKYFAVINEDEYNAYLEKSNSDYEDGENALTNLKSSLSSFFSAAPTSSWKKLFRTYLPLGYTTKNMSRGPDGLDFIVPDSIAQGDPNIPQASRPSSFRLISCWNSDILITDFCYQNKYPAKTPTPFHRGVSFYSIDGQEEETANVQ